MLDLEEVDDFLANAAVFDFLIERRTDPQRLPEEVPFHPQAAAGHDVVKRRHAFEQRDVLKRSRDASRCGLVGFHPHARPAAPADGALLRVVEAVDDVEHRGLAGAVRPNDRPYLAFADVERDVGDRFHAAKGERDMLDRKQNVVGFGRHAASAFVAGG